MSVASIAHFASSKTRKVARLFDCAARCSAVSRRSSVTAVKSACCQAIRARGEVRFSKLRREPASHLVLNQELQHVCVAVSSGLQHGSQVGQLACRQGFANERAAARALNVLLAFGFALCSTSMAMISLDVPLVLSARQKTSYTQTRASEPCTNRRTVPRLHRPCCRATV